MSPNLFPASASLLLPFCSPQVVSSLSARLVLFPSSSVPAPRFAPLASCSLSLPFCSLRSLGSLPFLSPAFSSSFLPLRFRSGSLPSRLPLCFRFLPLFLFASSRSLLSPFAPASFSLRFPSAFRLFFGSFCFRSSHFPYRFAFALPRTLRPVPLSRSCLVSSALASFASFLLPMTPATVRHLTSDRFPFAFAPFALFRSSLHSPTALTLGSLSRLLRLPLHPQMICFPSLPFRPALSFRFPPGFRSRSSCPQLSLSA